MSMHSTRESGNAPGLPGPMPLPPLTSALSRRAALFGAVTAAGFGVSFARPAVAPAVLFAMKSPVTPDAGLIALADRLVSLVEREQRASERAARIEDAIIGAIGFPPQRPQIPIGLQTRTEVVGDMLVSTLTRPVHLPKRDAILDAHDAAVAAYEQRRENTEQRLGLPGLERRADRMRRRRDRWAADLAAMRPATPAGLGAKASALAALAGGDAICRGDALQRHAGLFTSMLGDAVRLGAGGRA